LTVALLCGGATVAQSEERDGGDAVVAGHHEGSMYMLEGRFTVPAPPSAVWEVLTDYDHLSTIVPSVVHSRIVNRHESYSIVEQDLRSKVLVFTKKVHLRLVVHERPSSEIAFQDVSHEDFENYSGSWTISPAGPWTQVTYHLRARPRDPVPENLLLDTFHTSTAALLNQLRAAIIHRNDQIEERR
jgi:ribosome-associated toxin RatA of RatAB toxin-antitoxin module